MLRGSGSAAQRARTDSVAGGNAATLLLVERDQIMEYTSNNIKVIEWPEPVRLRPAMYVGSTNVDGCRFIVTELVESMLNPICLCHADKVIIRKIEARKVKITYNGKGFPIECDEDNGIIQPRIYRCMMSLFGLGMGELVYEKCGHLPGIGAIANALSQELTLVSSHHHNSYFVRFSRGLLQRPLYKLDCYKELNEIEIDFDVKIFPEVEIQRKDLRNVIDKCKVKYRDAVIEFDSE